MSAVKFLLLQSCLLLALSLVGIQSSWALRCLQGGLSSTNFDIDKAQNTSNTTNVGTIRVTNSNQAAGTMLWQSPTYNTTFTCYDDYKTNATEQAYLYPDDNASTLSNAFKGTNLVVGILYNGRENPIENNSTKIATGQTALDSADRSTAIENCRKINKQNLLATNRCATPKTINVSYSLYIKSRGTGSNYTSASKSFTAFQLDGAGGRNSNGNFQEKLSNVQVNYVDCVPTFTTQNVDLGKYYSYQEINKVLRRTPFTLDVKIAGKDCASSGFAGRFTSNQAIDNTTLTASESNMKNNVGIRIYEENQTTPVELGKTIDFGIQRNNVVSKRLEAGVLFLKKPQAGAFSSTLNYEVWLK